jgi:hypothetical protein
MFQQIKRDCRVGCVDVGWPPIKVWTVKLNVDIAPCVAIGILFISVFDSGTLGELAKVVEQSR